MTEKATIKIPKTELDKINTLLTMTGDKIYQKFGLKRDETIIHTAKFSNNIEADIKLVICEGNEKPYTEGVLFKNGSELTHTDCEDTYDGDWEFEYENTTYIVTITTE